MTAILHMRDVSLGYGDTHVLSGVNLKLPRGAFATVVGASGSGKSTFLRAAAGLLPALSGSIECDAREVAWVPQSESMGLLHPVNVAEVVSAGSAKHGRLARREAEAALDSLGLSGFGHRRFDQLSGGQRQRALVARALLQRAPLMILDEPTSALDDESAARVRHAVAEHVQEGATVLYTTHSHEELRTHETIQIVVENGTIRMTEVPAWT